MTPPVQPARALRVDVLLFGPLRERVGAGHLEFSLPLGATGEDLLDRLAAEHEAIRAFRPHLRLAVNERYADPSVPLCDGDEAALIPPTSGG